MNAPEQFADYLVARRLKITSERLAIAKLILAAPGHLDVDALLVRLRRHQVRVSRATLYRTLAHLIDAGLVHRVIASDGYARYESMAGREHHDHMVCGQCGSILEFVDARIEKLLERACRAQRFTMEAHTLQIEGSCRGCSRPRS